MKSINASAPALARRAFLRNSATLAAGAAVAAAAPGVPSAAGRKRSIGANERIRIGIIGCGNRGVTAHMQTIHEHLASTKFEILGLADPWRIERNGRL